MQEGSRATRRYLLCAMFLSITLGFAVYRHSSFAIWNDSSWVFHPHCQGGPHHYWDDLRAQTLESPFALLSSCIRLSFLDSRGCGYRPLSGLWTSMTALLFPAEEPVPLPLLLAVGAILGSLAVCLFYVARHYVRHDVTAFGAVFLVLASPPLVGSSWVCAAGVQAAVPLMFCLSLLSYWSLVEGRHRTLSSIVLVSLLVLGPWVREFFGLNAILLLLLELRRRRLSWVSGTALLGFVHAMFPTALVHCLFLPELEVRPLYQLGTLSVQLESGGVRWEAPWHFLPLFPPTLLVLAALEALLRQGTTGEAVDQPADWLGRMERLVQRLAIPVWLSATIVLAVLEPRHHGYFGFALCLMIAALGVRKDVFLGAWFALMFVPIVRVFSEHVHYLYAIPPASIILAEAMESLWLRLTAGAITLRLRQVLAGLLVMIGLDQAMNLYAAYAINHATYRGMDEMAAWFTRNVPADSVVVTNVIHGDEIKWHSHNHFEIYWTITAGIDDPSRAADRPAVLEELLAQRHVRPVYFLDVDFDYTPDKREYHRHKYIHQADIEKRDLGNAHITRTVYPFVDPLRYLVPRKYLPFLGAPDLENDFARQRSPEHCFCHEVYANYRVYEVLEGRVRAKLDGPVYLAQEGLHGFNIVRVGMAYHALPQSEGAFEVEKFTNHGYSAQFSGPTLEAVREQIEAAAAKQR